MNITFNKLDSVNNPISIHGIYPYRGKISAIDEIQIIKQFPKNSVLLDPFCGSGTIVFEAAKHGLNTVGVDYNPIAIQITKGKLCNFELEQSISKISIIINKINTSRIINMPENALKYFHYKTANEIMHLLQYYDEFNDYEKAIFLGCICLAARGCNEYRWSSTQIGKLSENKKYINFYEKIQSKLSKHYFPINNSSKIFEHDARRLSSVVDKKSIDIVYTSPPYFDGLDYTANYTRIVHDIFQNNVKEIKKNLIQKIDTYGEDMKKCFDEIIKVTKDNAKIIFVVGDKKLNNKIVNGGEFFTKIIDQEPTVIIEREYNGTASKIWDQINKTKRKEQIILWDREKWN